MFNHPEEEAKIIVDETARAYMLEIGRWGKFLAIAGFIFMGLLLLLSIVMAISFSSLADGFGGSGGLHPAFSAIILALMIAIYFYPIYALYKYAVQIKAALATENQELFNSAFGYLKGMFKYMGIFMIIIIGCYVLGFIFGGLVAVLVGAG